MKISRPIAIRITPPKISALVGKPCTKALSKGKPGHTDKEGNHSNDHRTDKSHQPVIIGNGKAYRQSINGGGNSLDKKCFKTDS